MEILTFYLIGLNFKYLICSIYCPPGSDPSMFNELFFNDIVSKFPNDARVIITGDTNLNLYNPLKLGYIDIFIASMLMFRLFSCNNSSSKDK